MLAILASSSRPEEEAPIVSALFFSDVDRVGGVGEAQPLVRCELHSFTLCCCSCNCRQARLLIHFLCFFGEPLCGEVGGDCQKIEVEGWGSAGASVTTVNSQTESVTALLAGPSAGEH